MTQAFVSVVVFLVVLLLLPLLLRWYQQRTPGLHAMGSATRVVSAVAVGPQQRVVTVELGPEGERIWLVLGVTAQSITCLHSLPAANPKPSSRASLPPRSPGPNSRSGISMPPANSSSSYNVNAKPAPPPSSGPGPGPGALARNSKLPTPEPLPPVGGIPRRSV